MILLFPRFPIVTDYTLARIPKYQLVLFVCDNPLLNLFSVSLQLRVAIIRFLFFERKAKDAASEI
jgi:hypothetical protein